MSNQSSNNTTVILLVVGIIGGVLLLGFAAVFLAGFLFLQVAAVPPSPRATPMESVTSPEMIDSDSQDLASPTVVPAPVSDTAPPLQQPNDSPAVAPIPDTATIP